VAIYTYDDGGSDSLLTRLADGYLELLAPLKLAADSTPGERGPYLKTLAQLPVDPSEELILDQTSFSTMGPLPAAWVVVGGGEVETWQPDLVIFDQAVRVYLASGSPGRLVHGRLREAANTFGDDPGIFALWQHAIEYLNNQIPLPNSGSIRIDSHAPVFSSQEYSIWTIGTRIRMQLDLYPSRAEPLVDRLEANLQTPPGSAIASTRRDF
jgi:hypothetical protein